MSLKKLLLGTVAVALIAVAGAYVWAERHPAMAPVTPPARDAFPRGLVDRGEMLSAAGYCGSCHTQTMANPYAGGRAMETPFGTVYATNITPDPETGIGTWSEAAFRRAMHEGIRDDGAYLYPAFPYDHFTLITDADISALYAYFMTRQPIRAENRENDLPFPFSIRTLLAGWNLLYFRPGRFEPDPAQDAEWNRGAYLVEALGHCGACHTPRNIFGAPQQDRKFHGARVHGWFATGIGAQSPSPLPWTDLAMVNYLIDGWDRDHGIAGGPMTPVVNHLAVLEEEEIEAMATYLLSFQQDDGRDRNAILARARAVEFASQAIPEGTLLSDPALRRGQERFAASCADCHTSQSGTALLALTSSVNGPDPINLINVTLGGIRPPDGVPEKSMPRFATMSDADLRDLVAFIRHHFSERPAWENIDASIAAARRHLGTGAAR